MDKESNNDWLVRKYTADQLASRILELESYNDAHRRRNEKLKDSLESCKARNMGFRQRLAALEAKAEPVANVDDVAHTLLAAFQKAEPDHAISKNPMSFMATFADMARAVAGCTPSTAEAEALSDLVDAAICLLQIVEGIQGLHFDTWRATGNGVRLRDTEEWVRFYLATHKAKRIREGE